MIRKSTINDKESIEYLIKLCFGDRNDLGVLDNLNGRYYLYFEDNILVAMSGISSDSKYGHLEVDWTCTHPDYRHNGYMQELFSTMLNNVKDDVYCSCWRLHDNDKVNLHTLMLLFGFKEVVNSRIHVKVPHNCFRNNKCSCVNYIDNNCECYEDLYLRKLNS